jgi:hypothetical protein
VAIGVLLVLAIVAIVWDFRSRTAWEDFPPGPGGGESNVSGEEYETSQGKVVAYLPNGIGEFPGEVLGSNVSLVHLQSGRTAQVIPPGSSKKVAAWQVLQSNERAVAYLARVADTKQFTAKRADIVIGSLPGFQQIVIARNAPYADSPTVYGDTLAVIVWPDEDEAQLVTVDLKTMQITRTQRVEVPTPVPPAAQSAGTGKAPIKRKSDREWAPRNAFD